MFIHNFCSLSQHDKYKSRALSTVEHYIAGICRMSFSFFFFLFLLAFFPLIPHSKLCTDGVLCIQCHFFPASLANVFQLTCHTVGNYQCQHKNMFCLTDISGILLCIPCSHCDSISFHQTSCSKCTHSGLTC